MFCNIWSFWPKVLKLKDDLQGTPFKILLKLQAKFSPFMDKPCVCCKAFLSNLSWMQARCTLLLTLACRHTYPLSGPEQHRHAFQDADERSLSQDQRLLSQDQGYYHKIKGNWHKIKGSVTRSKVLSKDQRFCHRNKTYGTSKIWKDLG